LSKKSDLTAKLLAKIDLPGGIPEPLAEGTLLEQGIHLVLVGFLPAARARAAVEALRTEYVDWNEARVAQAQELAGLIAARGGSGAARLAKYLPAAREVKAFLQEVFQKTHGLDLEPLREDPQNAPRVITSVEQLGNSLGSIILWLAEGGAAPVTPAIVRVLDRLGLIARTGSMRKAREAMLGLAAEGSALRLAVSFGLVADRWCHQRKPSCWECVLVDDCSTGRKVLREWKVQQTRLAAQHAREQARRLAAEERERKHQAREAERVLKRAQTAARKLERERERRAGEQARKKAAEANKKEQERRRAAAARKAAPGKEVSTRQKKTRAGRRSRSGAAPAQDTAGPRRKTRSGGAKKTERASSAERRRSTRKGAAGATTRSSSSAASSSPTRAGRRTSGETKRKR